MEVALVEESGWTAEDTRTRDTALLVDETSRDRDLLFLPKYVVAKYESDFADGAELVGDVARGTEDETRGIVIRLNIRKVSANEEPSVLKGGRRGE